MNSNPAFSHPPSTDANAIPSCGSHPSRRNKKNSPIEPSVLAIKLIVAIRIGVRVSSRAK